MQSGNIFGEHERRSRSIRPPDVPTGRATAMANLRDSAPAAWVIKDLGDIQDAEPWLLGYMVLSARVVHSSDGQ